MSEQIPSGGEALRRCIPFEDLQEMRDGSIPSGASTFTGFDNVNDPISS